MPFVPPINQIASSTDRETPPCAAQPLASRRKQEAFRDIDHAMVVETDR
jgi:hypothetical protein